MKIKHSRNDYLIIALISIASGITIQLVEIVIIFHYYMHTEKIDYLISLFSVADVSLRIVINSLIAIILFLLNFEILNSLNKLFSPRIKVFVISPVLTIFLSSFLYHFFASVHTKNHAMYMISEGLMMLAPIKYLFTTIVVVFLANIINITSQRKNIQLENEKLHAENLQSKYEALRNQINPHFLFNSLNALNLLIEEKPAAAQEYVEQLSAVLRYILTSSEESTVKLSSECEFINSYIQLLKTRYEDNLNVVINIDEKYSDFQIPPLSLQLLIENAVKHNIISKNNPLNISITSTDKNTITVKNNLSPKLTTDERKGTGLANLSKRYHLIAGKEIKISSNSPFFTVEIPVLKKYENNNS
jgi:Putative regulator of cell autolysis